MTQFRQGHQQVFGQQQNTSQDLHTIQNPEQPELPTSREKTLTKAVPLLPAVELQETTHRPNPLIYVTETEHLPVPYGHDTETAYLPNPVVDSTATTRMPVNPIELINTRRMPRIEALSQRKSHKRPSLDREQVNQRHHKGTHLPYLKSVMSRPQKVIFFSLFVLWIISLVFFWNWWLLPEHVITRAGMIINSLVLLWSTVLPGYYFFFVARMHEPDPSLPLPDGRVAIVVTKAPSEPWAIVEKTLMAMKAQNFPHPFDVWLADEDPSEEIMQWCIKNSIWVSCRKNMPDYQNESWPRRKKSKEGNLAYFYDTCGYRQYDFVAQLDADHVPEPDYLTHMIAPFYDTAVGYVAAPSICDANASSSWVARARLYTEAGLHGAMQAGHSYGFAPLCIGSHYAVRTNALKEIGGLGPELAEDHSTTLLFNAYGWRGVFAFNALAHGDGAECLADSVTQEFQWSRSLTKLLLTLTPSYWKHLRLRLKLQFFFAQLWYPLSSGNMIAICLLPLIALITQTGFANVTYLDFLLHYIATTLTCLLIVGWIQHQGWLRPRNAKILSWETIVFPMVSWPWMFMGVIMATISTIFKKELPFRVTPKGQTSIKPMPNSVLLPYTLITIFTFTYAFFLMGGGAAIYHWFATANILFYTFVLWVCILGHLYDNRKYGLWNVLLFIKGSLWQVACATILAIIDLQLHSLYLFGLFFIPGR
jgi:cellulose synthase (UDP-forming)